MRALPWLGQRQRHRAAKPEEIPRIEKRPRAPYRRTYMHIPASPTEAAQRAPRGLCTHPSSLLGLPHRRTGLGLGWELEQSENAGFLPARGGTARVTQPLPNPSPTPYRLGFRGLQPPRRSPCGAVATQYLPPSVAAFGVIAGSMPSSPGDHALSPCRLMPWGLGLRTYQ